MNSPLNAANLMAFGASFFVFGVLWLFFSSSLDYLLISPTGRNVTELNQLDFVRQMVGVVMATVGAGLLTYGRATKTNSALQTTTDK